MTRTLPFGFQLAERAAVVRPTLEVLWSDRYGGRPVLRGAGDGDDSLVTDHAALAVTGTTLVQLKSRGTAVEAQRRNANTLAVVSSWANLATAITPDVPVGLTQSGASIFASSTNTLYSIITSESGLVAVEERFTASTARLYVYSWGGSSWSLVHSFDTGAVALWGGGMDVEGGTFILYAGDYLQPSTSGTVTLRETRVYDLDTLALRGTLHAGSDGGVRWREPRAVYLTTSGTHYVLTTVQVPRGSGDAADRVALFPYSTGQIGAHHPVGPPRVVYGVEDTERAAVAYGGGAVFVMAGSYVQRLAEGSSGSTTTVSSLDMEYTPEDERLVISGPGTLDASALQLRCRVGLGGTLIDLGVFWLAGRIEGSRDGWQGAAYGLWGMLKRERQQVSVSLREANGDAMTPGHILELILTGLGFQYSEDASLSSALHPAAPARMSWTLRYGRDYATLVRGLLRWTGCEIRTGISVDGRTPTAYVFRPGSRFGPSPTAATSFGGVGGHPLLEVVTVAPETISDVTIFPGGWDHQLTLTGFVDRQLMLDASEAQGVTWDTTPATRALARALAGADAGMLRCRPALEVELWDTVLVTDGLGGVSGVRRLVRSVALAAGRGRWEMRALLGLE